jgi:L-fuconolactonase
MRIDAHQHFWMFDPVRDAWISEEMRTIRKNFLPENLKPLLDTGRLDGCVAVQADQSEEETDFLLTLARQNDFIKGVVGWIDFRKENISERLSWYSQFKLVKGFRHIVQAEPAGFLSDKNFLYGIQQLHGHSFTYDILIYPHQLKETVTFIQKFPDQPFVIDHLAKPYIKEGKIEDWKKDISSCASFTNVNFKISGMVTEANWKNWKAEDFTPYLDVVLEKFGPKRLLYGSDWPVCLVAASYEQQLSIVENYIAKLSSTEKALIMGENAKGFYNI